MENKDKETTNEQLYQESYGINDEVRQSRLTELRSELESLVKEAGFDVVEDADEITSHKVKINARVKTLERIIEKIERYNIKIQDVFDVWGLEVVVNNGDDEARVVDLILRNYLDLPSEEDLTRSTGKRLPVLIHTGPTSSYAAHEDYHAETVSKKGPHGIVSIRVIEKNVWQRAQDPNDPLHHDNYRKRQSQLLSEDSAEESFEE